MSKHRILWGDSVRSQRYHAIIGNEGEKGRVHVGWYSQPFGLYFSINIRGKWYRRAYWGRLMLGNTDY